MGADDRFVVEMLNERHYKEAREECARLRALLDRATDELDRLLAERNAWQDAMAVASPQRVALWNAINALVLASGGRNAVSTARMNAVADVERALRALAPNAK